MLLHWARQAAAASLGTRLHWSISHFNCDGWNNDHQVHTDLLRCSSCSLLARQCAWQRCSWELHHTAGRLGGELWSIGPCSTEMRPLVVSCVICYARSREVRSRYAFARKIVWSQVNILGSSLSKPVLPATIVPISYLPAVKTRTSQDLITRNRTYSSTIPWYGNEYLP